MLKKVKNSPCFVRRDKIGIQIAITTGYLQKYRLLFVLLRLINKLLDFNEKKSR